MDDGDPLFLAMVRRLEAVGFRAWPAASVEWDGSWQIRRTPGHPSTRLNSVVPLDRGDTRDMAARIARAEARFAAAGIGMTVRLSPLAPQGLAGELAAAGFSATDSAFVMTADLAASDPQPQMDHLPTQDAGLFAEACLQVDTDRATSRDVLVSILSSIKPPHAMFVLPDADGRPMATALVVADNDMAGLSQVVVDAAVRRKGHGREIILAALRWAKLRGARQAWLQVGAGNRAAIALYRQLGFEPRYTYDIWRRMP